MVSRQETARPLLTPGEVMQLPPADELILVSGLPPIRAKKLKYYEDRTFTERVLPAPALNDGPYADRPAPRADDWSGQVRGTDDRLLLSEDNHPRSVLLDEGGLQQQRHPGLAEEDATAANGPEQHEFFGLAEDDSDPVADKAVIDTVSTAARVYGVNEGMEPDKDIVPGF
jgi:type IV secretion system protein VirD4